MTPITMKPMNKCPIWPNSRATVHPLGMGLTWVVESARAGGKYEIDILIMHLVEMLDEGARARLTTWLVDQRCLGSQCPKITREIVEYAKMKRPLHPHERAMRLLRFMAERIETIGTTVYINRNDDGAYAWSESTKWDEFNVLIAYLRNKKVAQRILRDNAFQVHDFRRGIPSNCRARLPCCDYTGIRCNVVPR